MKNDMIEVKKDISEIKQLMLQLIGKNSNG